MIQMATVDLSMVSSLCRSFQDNTDSETDWAGHWRGDNATDETVICPTSFAKRQSLVTLCGMGYNVREGEPTTYWAADLMHRMYHLPAIGQGYIDHYAEGYEGIIEQAAANKAESTHDSDGLQYFALEAYAHDIIDPGVGCPGPFESTPTSTSPAETATAIASASAAAATTSTTEAPENCHTHADGAVHCESEETSEPAVPENCHTHADGAVHCT